MILLPTVSFKGTGRKLFANVPARCVDSPRARIYHYADNKSGSGYGITSGVHQGTEEPKKTVSWVINWIQKIAKIMEMGDSQADVTENASTSGTSVQFENAKDDVSVHQSSLPSVSMCMNSFL